jgi:hypothetical protein
MVHSAMGTLVADITFLLGKNNGMGQIRGNNDANGKTAQSA